MPEIIAIGSANVDLIAKVHRFPKEDDEVAIKNLKTLGGGSAANVAIGVSRLGHSAGFIGLIGTDNFGDFLLKEFDKEDVDISFAKKIKGSSGMVFSVVREDGERVMYTSEGVASSFSKEHIPTDYIKSTKFVHLTNIEGENTIEAFEFASQVAKEANVKVVFDPGCIFAEKGINKLKNILKNCYIIKPNKVEAKMLTGTEGEEAAKKLLEAGTENVIITEGLDGCIVGNKNGIKRIPFVPKFDIKTIDLTGAGDSFSSGLLTALLENKSLDEAVDFAMQIGSVSTGISGARGTPRREDVGF